jgi:serine/threonine protein kinase
MRMGKYEMGRTLGEGHFGKVKLARHAETGRAFAIKILDRQRILAMKIDEQVRASVHLISFLIHGDRISIDSLIQLLLLLLLLLLPIAAGIAARRPQIKREIATLKLLKHPHVVRLYEVLPSSHPPPLSKPSQDS